ncbi:hypothetical protein GCM10010129_53870 [Streptomyces fumigatiscleroticus]|nr:hypothetical protein GCM10010129_53870 [Streptomyces fumigatiscleroticus]
MPRTPAVPVTPLPVAPASAPAVQRSPLPVTAPAAPAAPLAPTPAAPAVQRGPLPVTAPAPPAAPAAAPVVQRVPGAHATAASPPGSPPPYSEGAPPPAYSPGAAAPPAYTEVPRNAFNPRDLTDFQLDELTHRLTGRITRLLRTELRLDRERIGRLRDPRH